MLPSSDLPFYATRVDRDVGAAISCLLSSLIQILKRPNLLLLFLFSATMRRRQSLDLLKLILNESIL